MDFFEDDNALYSVQHASSKSNDALQRKFALSSKPKPFKLKSRIVPGRNFDCRRSLKGELASTQIPPDFRVTTPLTWSQGNINMAGLGIRGFEEWSASRVQTLPLSSLGGYGVGISATYYLQHLLSPAREPLNSALGGCPFSLETTITKEMENLRSAGIIPVVVFDGLEYGIKDDPFTASTSSAALVTKAFEVYELEKGQDAIALFKVSGTPTPSMLSEFFKMVLHKCGIEFTVAPYSALAQLKQYEKHAKRFIDFAFGPPELFAFGLDRIITKFSFLYETVDATSSDNVYGKKVSNFLLDKSTFTCIVQSTCLEELGNIPAVTFIDACILSGSSLLRPFPGLQDLPVTDKLFSNAVKMLAGKSVAKVCKEFSGDSRVKEMNYLDRYKRVMTAIKNHVVVVCGGKLTTLDAEHAPHDLHECIGQRLPAEVYAYLFGGMIRSRVLNWLTSGTILITSPPAGGESAEYKILVKDQLQPLRKQAISLLADSINRYYQRKEITTKVWFDDAADQKFNVKDELPSRKNIIRKWQVKEKLIHEGREKIEGAFNNTATDFLYCAVQSLANTEFAAKTITTRSGKQDVLQTTDEIVTNVIWRFLRLRDYVDDKHQLTSWGKVLQVTLHTLGRSNEQMEAAFIAVELLRLNLLNSNTLFPNCSGHPRYGTETDRRNCMLVSRLACTAKLRHQPTGYSGPLSRHMLAYQNIISAVHGGLRDLIEMCLTTLFLEGDAERSRTDRMEISLKLPFFIENSCALGITTKTYLDELSNCREGVTDPTSVEWRRETNATAEGWVMYAKVEASLGDAFHLWDAVYRGVNKAEAITKGMVKEKTLWDEVDEWLAQRK